MHTSITSNSQNFEKINVEKIPLSENLKDFIYITSENWSVTISIETAEELKKKLNDILGE